MGERAKQGGYELQPRQPLFWLLLLLPVLQ
jgi:hypothetical protein